MDDRAPGSLGPPEAERPRPPAAQRPHPPAAQRPHPPAAQRPHPPAARRRRRGTRITERDRELLSFLAEHRLVLATHVQAQLGISSRAAYARLQALGAAGLLAHEPARFHGQPGCFQITRRGLQMIGSELSRPRIDLSCYRHDVGLAWLWLAARSGVFGPMREVYSERRLRSHDGTVDGRATPLGVRLGGVGPGGRDRLHYPDLILVGTDGRRIAIELELSPKPRRRLERILAGYAADAHIDVVLYLVDDARVAGAVRRAAANLGISPLVHVQRARLAGPKPTSSAGLLADRATWRGRATAPRDAELTR